jgi:FKBP-type peptidyl-prolyl cis-trans isomerase (trigger factor)
MKPDIDRFLEVATLHLMTQIAPALGTGYAQSNVNIMAMMLMAVREEFDRAAARRVEENRALRQLFAEATPAVRDAALRQRLETAAQEEDTSFKVSDLERSNGVLRGLLIELHAHVEELDSPAARRIEADIWRELAASTERRRLMMGAF